MLLLVGGVYGPSLLRRKISDVAWRVSPPKASGRLRRRVLPKEVSEPRVSTAVLRPWLRRQRNVDLQDALRSRGLNTVGRKGELVSRLLSSVAKS